MRVMKPFSGTVEAGTLRSLMVVLPPGMESDQNLMDPAGAAPAAVFGQHTVSFKSRGVKATPTLPVDICTAE